jgi:pyruvate carboxylase subunit B
MTAIQLTETVLRDAHQSLLATRMRTEDMVPILPALDRIGYWSVEMWGGATFDACLRFLDEDPWERLRTIRAAMPSTRLQMLLRGQNLVGYKHYPDDVVARFVARAAANGIDVFRVFDALNDVRNMRRAIACVKDEGKHAEGTISYTVSPFHSVERYAALAKELEALGCDTLCIKDMAGLLKPGVTYDLVRALRGAVSIPIHLHCHATSGMAMACYVKAAEAGAAILDVAVSSMGGGTSQPPTESLIAALADTPLDTGLDLDAVIEVSRYFKEVRPKYARFESKLSGVDVRVLKNQIPGGMISNLGNQLREFDALDRIDEVLEEVPRVRADLGFPPLVTPSSQIVGTQAVLNVLSGERYARVSKEVHAYFLRAYGRPPAPMNADVAARVIGDEEPLSGRPADALEPGWEAAVAGAGEAARSDEDVLSFALFPQVAEAFFARRDRGGDVPAGVYAAVAALAHLEAGGDGEAEPPSGDRDAWKTVGRWRNLACRPRGG